MIKIINHSQKIPIKHLKHLPKIQRDHPNYQTTILITDNIKTQKIPDSPNTIVITRPNQAYPHKLKILSYLEPPTTITELLKKLNSQSVNDFQIHYSYKDIQFNYAKKIIQRHDTTKHLSQKEAEILRALISQPNKSITKSDLIATAWVDPPSNPLKNLAAQISRLRQKVEQKTLEKRIHTTKDTIFLK